MILEFCFVTVYLITRGTHGATSLSGNYKNFVKHDDRSQASLALATSQFLLPPFIACFELVMIALVVIVENYI